MNKIKHNKQTETVAKEGCFYINSDDGDTYILARVSTDKFQLISLGEGNRFMEPASSLEEAFFGSIQNFTEVTSTFTITPNN